MNEIGQPTWENQPTLDELRQQHPQVTEKAIVDYVNSLEVLEDHLRLRDTSHNCFLTRIWDSITGKTAQRQQIIDRNLTTALQTVSVWLQDLQLCQAESELAMAHMADKLIETRAGVMRLQQRHKILVAEVQDLNQRFEQFQNRVNHQLTQLEAQIQQMEAARLANVHLEQVFNKWQAGRFDNYPPLARLYLVIGVLPRTFFQPPMPPSA
jgi:ribosome-binding ATPase YchF (GTP1/OBG family)